jgi:amino acid permease
MDIFNIKSGEKLAYIFLIISPTIIGIVAVLMSFSADDGIDPKMLLAMFICLAISLYFAIQYKIHEDEKKGAEALSADITKELKAINAPETADDSSAEKNTKK